MATIFKRGGKGNRGGSFYIQWFDHNGKRQSRSARTTDKATAERIVAKLEAGTALHREGVIDPTLDAISRESQRTIESHLADYEDKLRAAKRTEKHDPIYPVDCRPRWIQHGSGRICGWSESVRR